MKIVKLTWGRVRQVFDEETGDLLEMGFIAGDMVRRTVEYEEEDGTKINDDSRTKYASGLEKLYHSYDYDLWP